ncbi:outer membrane beta-barrel protein [Hymenobacter metallicola]|uniref:PorT family protein n=1 Tax=Hymenobacter metallicola TaxID=2563114 RepID=A0A4Z0QC73_9BACT|nr:outer membrane beta-barrel protein [Hymenobacter metallicola]TGE26969.1 PorT family protein [Hymenobacter metallicola]
MKKNLQNGLLAAALVVAGATTAQAQVTFGPRVGLNVADIAQDPGDGDEKADTKMLFGPQVGLTLNAQFGNLSIQPSLLFSQKGFQTKEEETFSGTTFKSETSLRLSYAEIPVNLVYTTGETEGFQIFAGPYIGIGIGGKYKYEYSGGGINESGDDKIKFANKYGDDDTEYVRTLDLGLNAGVGYKAGPVQAQLGYGLGFSNLIPNSEDDKEPESKVKNRVFQLSLSYFFGE